MKIKVEEVKYNVLEELNFTIDNYYCNCYCMDWTENDEYSLRITSTNTGKEVYSCWFDSTLGIVNGNEEIYTDDDIQEVIDNAFEVIKEYIKEF